MFDSKQSLNETASPSDAIWVRWLSIRIFISTRGKNFLQKFIGCKDEPIKSTETRQGWKHNTTLIGNDGGKGRQNTTLHLLHDEAYVCMTPNCTNYICNRCSVVFLSSFSAIIPYEGSLVFSSLPCFCTFFRFIPTSNEFLKKFISPSFCCFFFEVVYAQNCAS